MHGTENLKFITATMTFYVQNGHKVITTPHTEMFTLPFIMLADDNDKHM
jgi:hypothetical protein